MERNESSSAGVVLRGRTAWQKIGITLGLALWVVAAFLGVQLFAGVLLHLLASVGISFDAVSDSVFSAGMGIGIYSATLFIVIGVPWYMGRRTSLKELGLSRFLQWRDAGWLGLGAVSYIILTTLLSALAMIALPFIDFDQKQTTGFETAFGSFEYALAFFGLVVVAPVAEEILFRGYLFGKLKKAKIKTWIAVVVTSLLFAIVHFQGNVGVDVFALSIVLCLLRVYSGSIWAPILLHMLKNGVAFYFLFINPSVLSILG